MAKFRFRSVALLLGALAAPAGVHAADKAELACTVQGLAPGVRSAMVALIDNGFEVRDVEQDLRLRSALRQQAALCGDRYSWSREAREAAFHHLFSSITVERTRQALAAKRVPIEKIEAAALANPALLEAARALQDESDTLFAFVDSFRADLEPLAAEPGGTHIVEQVVMFVIATAVARGVEADFGRL